jgi:predicted outer membrane protein
MNKAFVSVALAALCLGVAACASQKEPAEQALAAVEAKYQESAAELQKYLPERHAEIEASVASLRESMSKENYSDVVAEAGQVQQSLKRAIGESRVRRAQLLVEMESEWDEMAKTMPAMVAAMDKKITSQRGRPPKGMTGDEWKQTIAEYDASRDAWGKAAAGLTRANFEESVLAARDAKVKIAGIMEKLGVKPS